MRRTTTDESAAGLPDRARFVLDHCGQPMRFRSTVTQLRGGPTDPSSTTSARYSCTECAAAVQLHLTERPQPL
jgi:hypothetical protein